MDIVYGEEEVLGDASDSGDARRASTPHPFAKLHLVDGGLRCLLPTESIPQQSYRSEIFMLFVSTQCLSL